MRKVGKQVVVSMAVAAFCLTVSPLEAEIVQKCSNISGGFSIEFPEGWQLRENPEDGVSLIAFRPKEKADEVVYERMAVAFLENAGEDPDVFLKKHTADLEAVLPDFILVEAGSEDPPGFHSRFLVYTFTDNFITLKVRAKAKQWVVPMGNRTYLITATATVESFPEYEGIFRKIADSFQVAK